MLLGVSTTTIRRWHKAGKIKCFRTVGGHRRFALSEIRRVLLGRKRSEYQTRKRGTLVYARVSSHDQKDDLARQKDKLMEYCKEGGFGNISAYTDITSGLNARRKGLLRVLKKVSRGQTARLVITYRDRLTRFGYEYLEHFCNQFGCRIIAISENNKVKKPMQEELVEDLVAIITSFSGRLHGMRSAERRRKKQGENC